MQGPQPAPRQTTRCDAPADWASPITRPPQQPTSLGISGDSGPSRPTSTPTPRTEDTRIKRKVRRAGLRPRACEGGPFCLSLIPPAGGSGRAGSARAGAEHQLPWGTAVPLRPVSMPFSCSSAWPGPVLLALNPSHPWPLSNGGSSAFLGSGKGTIPQESVPSSAQDNLPWFAASTGALDL